MALYSGMMVRMVCIVDMLSKVHLLCMVRMVCIVGRNIWGIIWSRQDCNQSSVIRVMSALRPGQALAQGTGTFTGPESKMQENTEKY